MEYVAFVVVCVYVIAFAGNLARTHYDPGDRRDAAGLAVELTLIAVWTWASHTVINGIFR